MFLALLAYFSELSVSSNESLAGLTHVIIRVRLGDKNIVGNLVWQKMSRIHNLLVEWSVGSVVGNRSVQYSSIPKQQTQMLLGYTHKQYLLPPRESLSSLVILLSL